MAPVINTLFDDIHTDGATNNCKLTTVSTVLFLNLHHLPQVAIETIADRHHAHPDGARYVQTRITLAQVARVT